MRALYIIPLALLALALWLASRAVDVVSAPVKAVRDLSPCLPWQGNCGARWRV